MEQIQPQVKISQDASSEKEGEIFENKEETWKRLKNNEFQDIINFRKKFVGQSAWIAWIWVGFLITLTIGQFSLKKYGCGLTEYEYIAIVGSASAPILAFWLVVGRGLFPKAPPGSG